MDIKNLNDVRSAISLLTANCNNMCNTTDVETIAKEFISAKDLLIALYKYNVERVSGSATKEN